MSEVKIHIDNEAVDFQNNTLRRLSLNSEIEGTGFNTRQSARMLPLKIPATGRNNVNQHHGYNYGTTEGDGLVPVIIKVGGMELISGKGKRTKSISSNQPNEYQLQAWGTNVDWVQSAATTTLADIAPASFVWNSADIDAVQAATHTNDPIFADVERLYPHLIYKHNTDKKWLYNHMIPALPIKQFFQRFFNSIGYTVVSEFYDSSEFNRLFMPFTFGRFGRTDTYYQENTNFEGDWDEETYSMPPNMGTPQSPIILFDETLTATGNYTINLPSLTILVDAPGASSNFGFFYVELRINGVVVRVAENQNDPDLIEQLYNESWDLLLNVGDVVELVANYRWFGTIVSTNFDVTGNWAIKKTPKYSLGETVEWDEILPKDLTFLDLWKGTKDCCDLQVTADPVLRTITFEPYFRSIENTGTEFTGFVDDSRTPINLDPLLNLSKSNTIEDYDATEQRQEFVFKQDSKDGYLTQLEKEQQTRLYKSTYIYPERFKAGTRKNENHFFAPTVHTILGPNLLVPVLVSDVNAEIADNRNNVEFDFKPRILYFAGQRSAPISFNGSTQNWYHKSFQVDYQSANAIFQMPSLSYATQVVGGAKKRGLFSKYYHRDFYQRKLRNFKYANIRYSRTDWLNIDHRTPVGIHNQLCYLVSAKNFDAVSPETTKCELRKLQLPDIDDLVNIIDDDTPGIIDLPPPPECFASLIFNVTYDESNNRRMCFLAIIQQSSNANAQVFVNVNGSGFTESPGACFELGVCVTDFFITSCQVNMMPGFYTITVTEQENGVNYEYSTNNGATYLNMIDNVLVVNQAIAQDSNGYVVRASYNDSEGCEVFFAKKITLSSTSTDVCGDLEIRDFSRSNNLCCGTNSIEFRLDYCDGESTLYTIQVTDTSDPLNNYIITES